MLELSNGTILELIKEVFVEEQLRDFYLEWTGDRYPDARSLASLRQDLFVLIKKQSRLIELLEKAAKQPRNRSEEFLPRLVVVSEHEEDELLAPELHAKLEELARLLGSCFMQCRKADVQDAFKQGCPELARDTPREPCRARFLLACVNRAYDSMVGKERTRGRHPLPALIQELAARMPQEGIRNDLKAWAQEVTASGLLGPEGVPHGPPLPPTRPPVEVPLPPMSCRLILDVVDGDEQALSIRAYLRGPLKECCLRDGVFTRAQVPELLQYCRGEIADLEIEESAVWVEWFLPVHLLNLDVDQWLAETIPELAKPLGFFHPVCIRLRERCLPKEHSPKELDKTSQARWRTRCKREDGLQGARWTVIPCCSQVVETCAAAWFNTPVSSWDDLDTYLLRNQGVLCLLLRKSPTPQELLLRGQNVMTLLFRSGIPRAVWVREVPEQLSASGQEQLENLFNNQSLRDLPQRIFELRNDAQKSSNKTQWHLGKHLTFLWDHPDRPHPLFRKPQASSTESAPLVWMCYPQTTGPGR